MILVHNQLTDEPLIEQIKAFVEGKYTPDPPIYFSDVDKVFILDGHSIHMQPVDQIKSDLDGKTKIAAFYDTVTKDKQLQAYIEQATDISPYTNDGDLLLYILNQNPAAVASDINIKDALAKFLKVMGIEHQVDQTSLDRSELVLDATPAWLSLSGSYIDILLENIPKTLGRTA